jgi:hypothetical protein
MPAPFDFSFTFTDPKYREQETALRDLLENKDKIEETLNGIDMHTEAKRRVIRMYMEIQARAYTISRTLGLQAIAEGELTGAELAKDTGVHVGEVSNWVMQAQEDPEHDYVNEPLHMLGPVKESVMPVRRDDPIE